MTKKEIAIVLGATANMTFALSSTLMDIKKYVNLDFELYVYHKDISEIDKQLLNSIIPVKFIEYDIDSLDVRDKSLNRYSRLAFSRYECFDMLEDYKKVLWLDIDVIIQKDLKSFIDNDLELGMWQTCVRNGFNFTSSIDNYDMDVNYYNSGVLLISDKIKNYNLMKEWCYKKTKEWGSFLVCPDQGVLNLLIQEFNINVSNLSELYNCNPETNIVKDAFIIHTYAEEKFWNYYYNFDQWNYNYKKWLQMGGTPYKGTKAGALKKFWIKFKKKYMPAAPDPKRHTGKFIKYIYAHNKNSYKKSYFYYLTRTFMSKFMALFTKKESFGPFGYYKNANEYFLKNNNKVKLHFIKAATKNILIKSMSIKQTETQEYILDLPDDTVLEIPNGRVWGNEAIIITHDNKIIQDKFLYGDYDTIDNHRALSAYKIPEAQYIKGKVAVIASIWADCYYHYVLDILPRLYLLKEAGIEPDKYIFNKPNCNFHKELLKLLRISEDKILYIDDNTHIKAENLIAPALPGSLGNPPEWVIDFYKNLLPTREDSNLPERIYISRNNATRRKVLNEDEVTNLLKGYGFVIINMEEHPIEMQFAFFKYAKVIVAPHGAGLSNVVFAQKNLKVLELFPPEYINNCFNVLYNYAGVDSYMLTGKSADSRKKYLNDYDILININELQATLNLMGLK